MKENSVLSNYVKMDLRRLWPVVLSVLYPETNAHIREVAQRVSAMARHHAPGDDFDRLDAALLKLAEDMEKHIQQVNNVIADRLSAHPYGTHRFAPDYFIKACEQCELSSADLKSLWNNIRSLSKRCFAVTRSTAEEKLALAKLNALEQDILYILFVEHQYLFPQILKPAADPGNKDDRNHF